MNLIILYQKYKNLMGLDPQEPRPRGGQHEAEPPGPASRGPVPGAEGRPCKDPELPRRLPQLCIAVLRDT